MIIGFAMIVWHVGEWFMGLKDPVMAQGAFVSTVYGAIPFVVNFYCTTGNTETSQ